MGRINNNEDIRRWADEVVAAKGEMFTPLSKGEQYLIAQYIKGMECGESGKPNEKCDNPEADTPQVPKTAQTASADPASMAQTSKETMTRSYAYHRAAYTAQQTFDEFLKWANEHPQYKEVMDFSTGKRSIAAAFAFWLGEVIEVDVPNGAK